MSKRYTEDFEHPYQLFEDEVRETNEPPIEAVVQQLRETISDLADKAVNNILYAVVYVSRQVVTQGKRALDALSELGSKVSKWSGKVKDGIISFSGKIAGGAKDIYNYLKESRAGKFASKVKNNVKRRFGKMLQDVGAFFVKLSQNVTPQEIGDLIDLSDKQTGEISKRDYELASLEELKDNHEVLQ